MHLGLLIAANSHFYSSVNLLRSFFSAPVDGPEFERCRLILYFKYWDLLFCYIDLLLLAVHVYKLIVIVVEKRRQTVQAASYVIFSARDDENEEFSRLSILCYYRYRTVTDRLRF